MEKTEEQKAISIPNDLTIQTDGTAVFNINEEGSIQGNYRGIFTFRCYLSPLDSLAAGKAYREYLGPYGESASEQDRYLAFCLSQLAKRIIKAPPWWTADQNAGNIPDLNVLSLILDRALTAESVYKQQLVKIKEEALEKAVKAAETLQESLNPKKERRKK